MCGILNDKKYQGNLDVCGRRSPVFVVLPGESTLQYSIYAGRHIVEGLLLECIADINRVWSPLGVPRWSSTARLITKYLVNMIKVCFCSNNDGDY